MQKLKEILSVSQERSPFLAGKRSASTWLTALPIENMGFTVHKTACIDAIFLRYGLNLTVSLLCLWKCTLNQTHLKRGVSHSPP